jgi:gamma-glutamyltranspeptidase/glutathione hydrolase
VVVGAEAVLAEQSTGRGRRGVVVAAAPAAAAIGAEAMRAGGNAYDAAVAALLAETVLLPPKCGLAGDVVALVVEPGDAAPTALLAIGGAPRRLADAVRRDRRLPATGPLAVGVPGAPAGYAALAERARLPLDRLAAPAVALATGGFPWAPICAVLCDESAGLVAQWNPGGTAYFPDGRSPAPGQLIALPGLARALDAFVRDGAALFGAGSAIGAAVVARVQGAGGVLDVDDLATGARAEWCAPAHATNAASGWDVWATPAPTHGPSLLDAVVELPAAADAGAVLAAVRESAARRRATLGDPMVAAGTSMVSAADDDGRAIVVVHSNSYPRFGSGLVVDEYDLILANRAGRGFSAEEGHPNFPVAGRRPATTLHAWAAAPTGAPGGVTHLGGTPGGVNQMPWNAQTLRDLLAGRTDPGVLSVAPKWEWLRETGEVRAEHGVRDADVESLRTRADVTTIEAWALRSATQVVERPRRGRAVVAGVDPRTGGLALGV